MPNFTPKREVAKFAVNVSVYVGALLATEAVINEISDESRESSTPRFSSQMVATGVMFGTKKRTDALVDRVADWRLARKAEEAEHPEEVSA